MSCSPKTLQQYIFGINIFKIDFIMDSSFPVPLVGSNNNIFREYLRLTRPPDPSTVRPPCVLTRSLDAVLQRYAEERDYAFLNSQLKSIRQDLLVQHVRDKLTLKCYQAHARIALQCHDMLQFAHCTAAVIELYMGKHEKDIEKIPYVHPNTSAKHSTCNKSSVSSSAKPFSMSCSEQYKHKSSQNEEQVNDEKAEFHSYYLLASILGAFKTNFENVYWTIKQANMFAHPYIVHAMAVREAFAFGNYYSFCRLYVACPSKTLASYLLEPLVLRMRSRAFNVMLTAYRPMKLDAEWMANQLAFDSVDEMCACATRLGCSFVIVNGQNGEHAIVDTKLSIIAS